MSKSLYTTIIEETAPTTTTVGVVGQLYLDSTTKILYQCVAINIEDLTYEWKQIGGSSGVSQEDFDKLVNNEIFIKPSNKRNIKIGTPTFNSDGGDNIAIGNKSTLYTSNAWGSVQIGNNTIAHNLSVAIGYNAKCQADKTIQIGVGTNSTENTLQIYTDNIYNHNTHTLTVQNIELNGTDLNTTINEVTSKAMRALVTPVSAPSKIELVAVDSTNAQTMIEIGDGIVLENGVLKSKYWEEVIYSSNELFKTNTTYNFTKTVGSYETIELELRSGGHNSSYFVKMKTIPSGGNTYVYIPEHNDSVLNQIVISFTDTSMTVENSLIELTDYDNWVLQKIRWIHR